LQLFSRKMREWHVIPTFDELANFVGPKFERPSFKYKDILNSFAVERLIGNIANLSLAEDAQEHYQWREGLLRRVSLEHGVSKYALKTGYEAAVRHGAVPYEPEYELRGKIAVPSIPTVIRTPLGMGASAVASTSKAVASRIPFVDRLVLTTEERQKRELDKQAKEAMERAKETQLELERQTKEIATASRYQKDYVDHFHRLEAKYGVGNAGAPLSIVQAGRMRATFGIVNPLANPIDKITEEQFDQLSPDQQEAYFRAQIHRAGSPQGIAPREERFRTAQLSRPGPFANEPLGSVAGPSSQAPVTSPNPFEHLPQGAGYGRNVLDMSEFGAQRASQLISHLMESREYDRLLKSEAFMSMVQSLESGTRVSQAKLEQIRNIYMHESAQLAQLGNERAYQMYASILHHFMDRQMNDPSLTDERLAVQIGSQDRFFSALSQNLEAQSNAAMAQVRQAQHAATNPFVGIYGNPMQFRSVQGTVPLMDRESGDVAYVPVTHRLDDSDESVRGRSVRSVSSSNGRSVSPSGVTGTGAPIFDVAADLQHRGRSRIRIEEALHQVARDIKADGVRGFEPHTRQEVYVPTDRQNMAASSSGLSQSIPVEVTRPTPAFGGEKNMGETYKNLRTLAEEGGGASSSSVPEAMTRQRRSQSRPRVGLA
jgi:hypothetical protein